VLYLKKLEQIVPIVSQLPSVPFLVLQTWIGIGKEPVLKTGSLKISEFYTTLTLVLW